MFSLTSPSLASEVPYTEIPELQVGQRIGNCVVVNIEDHTLSTEEVIEYYITEKNYSLTDARKQALALLSASESIATKVVTVNATDDLGLTSNIELGCRVRQTHSGGRTSFAEILDSWTGIVSSGIQNWIEFTHSAEIVGDKHVSIDFYARGTIDIQVSRSISQGFSVSLLESLGYSIEETTSTTWTVRKVVDLNGTYTQPGYT